MKIVVLENSVDVERGADALQVVLGADSALLRPGEPVFTDDDAHWESWVVPAVRIGRLGIHIPERVAGSYIDAHALMHLLVPEGCDTLPGALWGLSDRAFSPGKWQEGNLPEGKQNIEVFTAPLADDAAVQRRVASVSLGASTAIAAVSAISRVATLKTGDIIVLADQPLRLPVTPDTRLRANLNQEMSLDIKIK